jgi:hypothetical protein
MKASAKIILAVIVFENVLLNDAFIVSENVLLNDF